MRALQATGASATQAVGAGYVLFFFSPRSFLTFVYSTVIDLFDIHERGNAMGFFLLGPLIGPVIGPIAGGYINECKGFFFFFYFHYFRQLLKYK